ncbi:hypothetical protein K7X08_021744 [Anisodus acutangulus]|uniref:Pentatricopeptide repeat-containing protein n=1 Tax=Anisodus acutangulus TaxID=402998 RepID=A0A9Q1M737_9SOLA|nr:hypothetical protein K7X08_021744 [Anisodus acutangulus]
MALKACSEISDLRVGRGVHGQIIKTNNDEPDQVVYNALLGMYSECGCFRDVLKVFEEMPERNVASWNSFIVGFVKKGQVFEAFESFRRMQREGVGYSWVTFTTILAVCSQVTYLYYGREVHSQVVKSNKIPDVVLLNSLLDMYAKCGAMEYCKRVFDRMKYKDIASWNTVINGLHGNVSLAELVAEQLFEMEPNNCGNYVMLSNIYANAEMWEGVEKGNALAMITGDSHSCYFDFVNPKYSSMEEYTIRITCCGAAKLIQPIPKHSRASDEILKSFENIHLP